MDNQRAEEVAKLMITGIIKNMYCYMGSGMLSNEHDDGVALRNAKDSAITILNNIPLDSFKELHRVNQLTEAIKQYDPTR